MDPLLNHEGMFANSISDEEIDIMNADDVEEVEQFDNTEEVYIEGVEDEIYEEEDGIQYGDYIDEEQFDGGTSRFEAMIENPDYLNAHYINTDEELYERQSNMLYQLFENPNYVFFITPEERVAANPEMKLIPPVRRSIKEREYKDRPIRKYRGKTKLDPHAGAVEELLTANKIYPTFNSKIEDEEVVREPFIEPSYKFLSQPRLTTAAAMPKDAPQRKIFRPPPRPSSPPEPKSTKPFHDKDHLTPLPDRYFQRRLTITPEQAGFISDCLPCAHCNFLFRSKSVLDAHLKKHDEKGDKTIPVVSDTAGMYCPVKRCDVRCDTIATIVKHMKTRHFIHDLAFERIVFKDFNEFKMWRAELERLTVSKFSRTSGKQNVFSKSTYYQCHHSGKLPGCESTNLKARNRQSKKLGKTCTAFFHVRENEEDGTVLFRGCTKHSGHGFDIRQLPLSEDIKMEIAHFLIEGLDENAIVERMREDSDADCRRYYLQNYEVRNVAMKIEKVKEEFKRKIAAGEPIPNLAEVVIGRRREEFPANNYPRAKLACSRYPVSMNHGYEEELQQNYEYDFGEVVEEDGLYNVPSMGGVPRHRVEEQLTEEQETAIQRLIEMPNNIKGRRRAAVETDIPENVLEEDKNIVKFNAQVEEPFRKTPPVKNVAKRKKLEDIDFKYQRPLDKVDSSTPIRFSSRLRKKERKVTDADLLSSAAVLETSEEPEDILEN